MEEQIKTKLEYLCEMLKKYDNLANKTGHYRWRGQAIEMQIDVLEDILYNRPDRWQECYDEDVIEAKREGYIRII
jgi:hypothetical protein